MVRLKWEKALNLNNNDYCFNLKMVRLKLIIYLPSKPLLCSFNLKMVRLKSTLIITFTFFHKFQSQNGTIKMPFVWRD